MWSVQQTIVIDWILQGRWAGRSTGITLLRCSKQAVGRNLKKKKNNSTPLTSLAFTACNVDLRINVVHLRGGERKLSGVCG